MSLLRARNAIFPVILALTVSVAFSSDSAADNKLCLTQFVAPEYPDFARAQGYSGTVRARVLIGATGTWRNISIVEGNSWMHRTVIRALEQWRFCNCISEGREIDIAFHFRLAGERSNYWNNTLVEIRRPADVYITTNPPYELVAPKHR